MKVAMCVYSSTAILLLLIGQISAAAIRVTTTTPSVSNEPTTDMDINTATVSSESESQVPIELPVPLYANTGINQLEAVAQLQNAIKWFKVYKYLPEVGSHI